MIKKLCYLLLMTAVYCLDVDPEFIDEVFLKPLANSENTGASTGSPTQPPVIDTNQQDSTIVPPPAQNFDFSKISCKLADGSAGVCVLYYQCDEAGSTIVDGANRLDIRGSDRNSTCGTYMARCCSHRRIRPPSNPIKPKPEPLRKGCGWSNPKGADMRTTGEAHRETKFGEFPWMVAILRRRTTPDNTNSSLPPNGFFGGGALIHPSVVLTGAHVITKSRGIPLKVRAGEWDTQSNDEIHPYQERDVASLAMHPDYNKANLYNDVVLLFLAQPVNLAPHIGLACLPSRGVRTAAGTRCFATGWGSDDFGKDGLSVILKKVEVPVVDHASCETALRKSRLGEIFELHGSFMCAGGERGKDTCKGDGGAPLSCPVESQKDRFIVSGLVAWGIDCGVVGRPGVYVDVSAMREWIDDKMSASGY